MRAGAKKRPCSRVEQSRSCCLGIYRLGERMLPGHRGRHIGANIAAEIGDLAHQRAGHMRMRGIGEHKDGLDAGEVPVHDRHGRFIGHIDLRTDALHEHLRTHLGDIIHQQAHAPGRHDHGAAHLGLGNGLLQERHALRDR